MINGKYEGKGTLYHDNGIIKCFGSFSNGQYQGKGTMFKNDKLVY